MSSTTDGFQLIKKFARSLLEGRDDKTKKMFCHFPLFPLYYLHMPTTPVQERKSNDLAEIKKIVEQIQVDVNKHVHPSFWKHLMKEFAVGMIRGIGLVIGTTIVAGIIIYALQAVIDWSSVQGDIIEWISQIMKQGIEDAVPSGISSFLF